MGSFLCLEYPPLLICLAKLLVILWNPVNLPPRSFSWQTWQNNLFLPLCSHSILFISVSWHLSHCVVDLLPICPLYMDFRVKIPRVWGDGSYRWTLSLVHTYILCGYPNGRNTGGTEVVHVGSQQICSSYRKYKHVTKWSLAHVGRRIKGDVWDKYGEFQFLDMEVGRVFHFHPLAQKRKKSSLKLDYMRSRREEEQRKVKKHPVERSPWFPQTRVALPGAAVSFSLAY